MTNQATNRSQVSTSRFSIRYRQASADSTGTTGENGTLNGRGRSGRVRRSTGTAADTSTKANSVPMLTRFARLSSGTNVAVTSTSAAYSSVIRTGVPVRGLTLAIDSG